MIIKLLKPYGLSEVGDILPNVNRPIAEQLIKRKIAKVFKPKKKKAKNA